MSLLITWLANSLAILFVANFIGGVAVASTLDAFIAGAVLSVVNAVVRPVLVVLTLPFTILTLGLFYFVVTGICLALTAYVLPGLSVSGALGAIVASILITIVRAIVTKVLNRAAG